MTLSSDVLFWFLGERRKICEWVSFLNPIINKWNICESVHCLHRFKAEKMGRTKETELPSLRIYLGRQNTLDGNSAVKPVRETEKNSNQSSVESVSAEKLTAVCGESNDVPACSGKRKRFELLDDELKEFKNLCKEKSSTKNRYLWSKGEFCRTVRPASASRSTPNLVDLFRWSLLVLNEIDEFKAGVLSRIEFHNSCMPILAEFFLKDENSIDKEELKRMNLENERLKKGNTLADRLSGSHCCLDRQFRWI